MDPLLLVNCRAGGPFVQGTALSQVVDEGSHPCSDGYVKYVDESVAKRQGTIEL
jgi:hypothetical protein